MTWIGEQGSGHFVKMLHNGIEYADMQLIATSYYLMNHCLDLDEKTISDYFVSWNQGKLQSFLLEISAKILRSNDSDGTPIIRKILDKAGQKGTGSWSTIAALKYGVPASMITEAVLARVVSSFKNERIALSNKYQKGIEVSEAPSKEQVESMLVDLPQAMYAAKVIAYVQGYQVIQAASDEHQWNLDFVAITEIWRNGCIIRGKLLDALIEPIKIYQGNTYDDHKESGLLGGGVIQSLISAEEEAALRRVVVYGIESGIPVPLFATAISYLDSIRTSTLSANMIQAQRDFFGSHGFKRVDEDYDANSVLHHFDWNK